LRRHEKGRAQTGHVLDGSRLFGVCFGILTTQSHLPDLTPLPRVRINKAVRQP
jgi:hypothetical protein